MIEKKLKELKLTLNKKTSLFPLKQGVYFLKWKFVVTDTGRILMLINTAKVRKQKKRMEKLFEKELEKKAVLYATEDSLRSFLANCERGDTYKIIQYMKYYYKELTGEKYHERKVSREEIRRTKKSRTQSFA
jgi:hypothetical protein